MFGKAPSSGANKRLFGSSLSVRGARMKYELTQKTPAWEANPAAVPLFTIIDGSRQSRWWAWRSSSENRSCIWIIKESIQEEE